MDSGRIVQIGTPVAIYRRPAHPFIAGFIGQANLLEGTVNTVEGGSAWIDVGLAAPVHAGAEPGLARGARVQVAIKSEALRVERAHPGNTADSVAARVESVTFLGPTFTVNACRNPPKYGDTRLAGGNCDVFLGNSERTIFDVHLVANRGIAGGWR